MCGDIFIKLVHHNSELKSNLFSQKMFYFSNFSLLFNALYSMPLVLLLLFCIVFMKSVGFLHIVQCTYVHPRIELISQRGSTVKFKNVIDNKLTYISAKLNL